VYAGAYVYGKTRSERYIDDTGRIKNRVRHLPVEQWRTFLKNHHKGFIDWQTYETNQQRLGSNTRPQPHTTGGAVREGAALLQGLATCGHCGRGLKVYYQGKNSSPGYHCPGSILVEGRGKWCLRVGGCQIDASVAKSFLEAINPAGIEAVIVA
jgi:hypothetical protein